MSRTWRQIITVLLTTVVGCSAGSAFGQSPIVFAPVEYFLTGAIVPDGDQFHGSAGLVRSVPVFTLLPQTTPGSRIEVLRLEGGLRSIDSNTDFRFRITGADIEIQKRFKAAAVTLLDVDRTGLDDLSAEWLGIGFGPGIAYQRFNRSFEARVLARASVNTHTFGRSSFPELLSNIADRNTAVFYGVQSTIIARPAARVALHATGKYGYYAEETDIEIFTSEIGLEFRPLPPLAIRSDFLAMRIDGNGSDDSALGFGITVRYVNREEMY